MMKIDNWKGYSGIKDISVDNNILKVDTDSPIPLLISPDDLFINTAKYGFIVIKMKADSSYTEGRIFFRRIGDKGFSYLNSQDIPVGIGGIYHNYTVNMRNNPNWNGVVNQLIFKPVSTIDKIEIKSINIAEDNLLLVLSARYSDLLTFEPQQMRTVNFIYGPRINGISINLYIYIIIAFISIIITLNEYRISKNMDLTIKSGSMKIIIVCLLFWFALDLKAILDQGRTLMVDINTFYGKTFEEKRALIPVGNYYDFIAFCNSKIPKRSSFAVLAPEYYYYFGEKAQYYLYPSYTSKDADYVLVFDQDGSMQSSIKDYMNKGYKRFLTFKDGEYILKK